MDGSGDSLAVVQGPRGCSKRSGPVVGRSSHAHRSSSWMGWVYASVRALCLRSHRSYVQSHVASGSLRPALCNAFGLYIQLVGLVHPRHRSSLFNLVLRGRCSCSHHTSWGCYLLRRREIALMSSVGSTSMGYLGTDGRIPCGRCLYYLLVVGSPR